MKIKKSEKILLFGFILILFNAQHAKTVDLKGNTFSHDPATLVKDGDTYWHFYTAPGIGAAYSRDLVTWTYSGKHIFSTSNWKSSYPAWTIPYFGSGNNANTDGNLWAPDVIYMNGAYYLYYSCSSFGSAYSAIGVVKSNSLNNPVWSDLGKVVSSGNSTQINAIDPGLFKDDDGKVYMVYGSWSGGIGIVDIDTVTGLAVSAVTKLYGGNGLSVEAAALFKDGPYYYLVANRGTCCSGLNSTYYIIVGRSTSVKGPYTGFKTLLPNKDGKYVGPGHFSLYRNECANYVSAHYYNANENGRATYDILKMKMVDGWPVLYRNFTFDNCNDDLRIDAGSNATICENAGFDLNGLTTVPSAVFYKSVLWEDGEAGGHFADSSVLIPVYTPPADYNGELTLYFRAVAENDTNIILTDSIHLNILDNNVVVNAGSDEDAVEGIKFDLSTAATQASAENQSSLQWGDGGIGGKFNNYKLLLPIYTPPLGSAGDVTLTLTATGNGNCKSSDEMILSVEKTNVGISKTSSGHVKISPNPTEDGNINIFTGNLGLKQIHVEIYSLQGKLVKVAYMEKPPYSIYFNEKGMYLVKIKLDDRITTEKIIVR